MYQGAPTPVTGVHGLGGKAAGVRRAAAGVRRRRSPRYESDWQPVIWVLAVLTLVVGSVLAVVQTNVKRMLAYSSISHAGFILVGVEAAGDRAAGDTGPAAVLFYLLAYAVMVLGTLRRRHARRPHRRRRPRRSTRSAASASSRPVLALALTVFLLAQAGVPLTSGFVAKFGVIAAAVDAQSYALAVIAMLAVGRSPRSSTCGSS